MIPHFTPATATRRGLCHGFTLIELLVSISIIALLIALMMPALSKARQAGKNMQCMANLRQVAIADFAYAMDSKDYPVPMQVPYPKDATSRLVRMKYLTGSTPREAIWPSSTIPDRRVMFCPDRIGNARHSQGRRYQANSGWSGYAGNGAIRGVWGLGGDLTIPANRAWNTGSTSWIKIFERYDDISKPSSMLLETDTYTAFNPATNADASLQLAIYAPRPIAATGGTALAHGYVQRNDTWQILHYVHDGRPVGVFVDGHAIMRRGAWRVSATP